MGNRLEIKEEKELRGVKVMEQPLASKPVPCLIEWDKVKKRFSIFY